MSRDHFEVLGVKRAYHLAPAELETRFFALSREVHPDRFAKASPSERLRALQRTTELNDAYRVLKDPVRRAEYLLKLEGLDVADEKSSVKALPSLLMEMMERNEELADARAANDEARVQSLAATMRGERAAALAQVDGAFTSYEAGERAVLDTIAQTLIRMRYQARFLEQAEGSEEM